MSNYQELVDKLLKWYRDNYRHFPWREDDITPFQILIAEILLKRTRAENVVGVYECFFDRFSDYGDISEVEEQEIGEIIKSLGLPQRSREIVEISKQIEADGGVPRERERLLSYRGIGPYVASAVRTFSFEFNDPPIDANLIRFGNRFWNENEIEKLRKKYFEIGSLDNPREIFFAFLDFGALVCKSRTPECGICPLEKECLKNFEVGV